MHDLISRQDALDAVEESRRLNHHQDGEAACAHEYEHRHFLKILRDLPPAQPEIVRCKDCIHHHYENGKIPYCDEIDYGYGWKDEDYCSRGERQ